MALAQDILLDENYDLRIENGDFVIGPSDVQHVDLIFKTSLGHWKENPFLGIGIENYLGSNISPVEVKRDALVQLQSDGYKIDDIKIDKDYTFTVYGERQL